MKDYIGKLMDGFGKELPLDIKKLIETRLLVVSNSGGGKSHVLRKIIELCVPHVQVIVLDVEGDFSSLRAKYDFILAGKGGDIKADPKLADMLAKKTLELGASLIVDLYELKKHDRIRFVRLFLEAMIDAPKNLWHPVLVVIDEAHIFCPEKDKAESAGAVIDLATRGRKRGFASVLATQRISKLHKDAAAECLNKLVGRTGLDIDLRRANDELGFPTKDKVLRGFEPGEFFAYGPALSREVVQIKVGPTVTVHPKAGQQGKQRVQAPTAKIKAMLAKLADIPKEAAEELNEKVALQARVRELEAKLRQAPKPAAPVVDQAARERDLSQAHAQGHAKMQEFAWNEIKKAFETLKVAINVKSHDPHLLKRIPEARPADLAKSPHLTKLEPGHHDLSDAQALRKVAIAVAGTGDRTWGICDKAILGFLASRGEVMTKTQVAAITGYSVGSGGFKNSVSKLSTAGLIVRKGEGLMIGDLAAAQEILGPAYKAPGREALQDWIGRLGKCEAAIYKLLLESYQTEPSLKWTREEVATHTSYSPESGGFKNSISRLSTLGLIVRDGAELKINPELLNL